MKNAYYDYSLEIFEKFENVVPELLGIKPNVERFFNEFSNLHAECIKEYGELKALNNIYKLEVIKYYSLIFGRELNEMFHGINNLQLSNKIPEFIDEVDDFAIAYPTYKHREFDKNKLEHIPKFDVYNIKPDVCKIVASHNKSDVSYGFKEVFSKTAKDIALIWTKDKNPSEADLFIIADEIIENMLMKNKAAVKVEVIQKLVKETSNNDLLRYL